MIYVPFTSSIVIPYNKSNGHLAVSEGNQPLFSNYCVDSDVYNIPKDRPIYAFAYKMNDKTMLALLKQKPIIGRIMTKYGEPITTQKSRDWYFIPTGKQGQPILSKAIQFYGRAYADTENEAIAGFNALVQLRINKLNQLIAESQSEILPYKTAD